MSGVVLAGAGGVVLDLVAAINANRAWLSDIDGAIGDGDHGINMSKGFTQAGTAIGDGAGGLAPALHTLGDTLLSGIGGSMGPLYGTFFLEMAATLRDATVLDAKLLSRALHAGLAGIQDLGDAKVGDKTLLDALVPAIAALDAQIAVGASFAEALAAMSAAAERGRDSTIHLVARIGRAARLGERSRGVLDAGAASCCLILQTLASGLTTRAA